MTRENSAVHDRRSVLQKSTKAVGGLAVGITVVQPANAGYCDVLHEDDLSYELVCYPSSDLDAQYAKVTVDFADSDDPSGEIYGMYNDSCPTDSDYDQFENIDSDTESMRIENWEADPGYAFSVNVNGSAHVTVKECG